MHCSPNPDPRHRVPRALNYPDPRPRVPQALNYPDPRRRVPQALNYPDPRHRVPQALNCHGLCPPLPGPSLPVSHVASPACAPRLCVQVPKAIMHFMVNNVKRGLQQHLIKTLYRWRRGGGQAATSTLMRTCTHLHVQ